MVGLPAEHVNVRSYVNQSYSGHAATPLGNTRSRYFHNVSPTSTSGAHEGSLVSVLTKLVPPLDMVQRSSMTPTQAYLNSSVLDESVRGTDLNQGSMIIDE